MWCKPYKDKRIRQSGFYGVAKPQFLSHTNVYKYLYDKSILINTLKYLMTDIKLIEKGFMNIHNGV